MQTGRTRGCDFEQYSPWESGQSPSSSIRRHRRTLDLKGPSRWKPFFALPKEDSDLALLGAHPVRGCSLELFLQTFCASPQAWSSFCRDFLCLNLAEATAPARGADGNPAKPMPERASHDQSLTPEGSGGLAAWCS